MANEKTAGEKLQEQLLLKRENIGMKADDAVQAAADAFCEGYKQFIDACKVEREAVTYMIQMAKGQGYQEFDPGSRCV